MSTVSNGVDIVENIRINKAIKNISFVQRVFSKKEIELSKSTEIKQIIFAKRFAAKEAFYKTLGTGLRNNYKFKDITVKNDKYGKPSIVINEKLKKMIYKQFKLKKFKLHLSLSDEKILYCFCHFI